jgi:hypothetical protein
MSNYVKITDFAIKDTLPTGNPNKVASGTQVDAEFEAIETAIATKEDTANKNLANGYAGLDSNSDIADSQVPDTIPRLNLANIFTGAQSISNTSPLLSLRETDGPSDEKNWVFYAAGGNLRFGLATDAAPTSDAASWLDVGRTGTGTVTINFSGSTFTKDGSTIWHAGNDGSGSGLDADTVDGSHASAFAASSHGHAASDTTSGTFADARISLSSVSQHQASLTTRNITGKSGNSKTLSTAAASGGSDGDIWYRY